MTTGPLTNFIPAASGRRRKLFECATFLLLFGLAVACNVIESRLAFYAGQGKLDPRILWGSILWGGIALVPLPTVFYCLTVWALHPLNTRDELVRGIRLTAVTILIVTSVLGRPSAESQRARFLSGFADNLRGSRLQQLEGSLRTLAESNSFREITMTTFIDPDAHMRALADELFPENKGRFSVFPITENERGATISWGGHDFMWGIGYGSTEAFGGEQRREISDKLTIFVK